MKTAAFLVSGVLLQLTMLSISWSHHICRVYRWSRKESESGFASSKTDPEVTLGL